MEVHGHLEYEGYYRPPTLKHLIVYFKVFKSTLSGIRRNRQQKMALEGKQRRYTQGKNGVKVDGLLGRYEGF